MARPATRLDQRGNSARLTGVLSDAVTGVPGNAHHRQQRDRRTDRADRPRALIAAPLSSRPARPWQVDGSIVSPVTVAGTLRGIGTLGGAVTISNGGRLAPGDSPGTLTVAAPVVMSAGSTLALDIDGTGTGSGAGNYSRLLVSGANSSFTGRRHPAGP